MVTHVSNCGFGFVPLNWRNNEHRELPYRNEPFNNPEDLDRWENQGFTHTRYTGDMYDMRNDKPAWFDFQVLQNFFGWEELSWSFYRMMPGTILPEHIDTYKRFKELCPQYDPSTIYRAVIMLEDWKPGHIMHVGKKQMPPWRPGDYVWWKYDMPHLAANIGTEERYTLQLTGFKL